MAATATNAGLEPGARVSYRKTMTVAEQAMFTGISGNLGPLYVDAVKARALGAPGVLSFELVVASLLTTCLSRLSGPSHRIHALDLRFLAPVPVGGTIEASAEVIAVDGDRTRCRVTCKLDRAGTVVEGEATLAPLAAKV
jgi:3-hydroxybutyryl-CoA dehydratase